jgi:NADH-quinone oxidoreductase subunit J
MIAAFEISAFVVFSFVAVVGALGMATTMSMFRSGIFLMASFLGVAGLFILLSADLIGLLQIMMYIGGMLVMILFMVLFMHDPGGAMMAGLDMALTERWFSKGLVPRAPQRGEHGEQGRPWHEEHGTQNGGHGAQHKRDTKGEAHQHSANGKHDEGRASHHHEHQEHQGDTAQDRDNGHGMAGMDMSMVTPIRSAGVWLAVIVAIGLVAMLLLRPAWHVVQAVPDPNSARRIGQLLMEKYMIAFEGAGTLILIGIFGAVLLARPSSHPDDPSRAAPVAAAENPEPIEDDRLVPLAERRQE